MNSFFPIKFNRLRSRLTLPIRLFMFNLFEVEGVSAGFIAASTFLMGNNCLRKKHLHYTETCAQTSVQINFTRFRHSVMNTKLTVVMVLCAKLIFVRL